MFRPQTGATCGFHVAQVYRDQLVDWLCIGDLAIKDTEIFFDKGLLTVMVKSPMYIKIRRSLMYKG